MFGVDLEQLLLGGKECITGMGEVFRSIQSGCSIFIGSLAAFQRPVVGRFDCITLHACVQCGVTFFSCCQQCWI